MNRIEYLTQITESAKRYKDKSIESIKRNRHMNELDDSYEINQATIDAILVDFINHIGNEQCIDFALYTKDLHD